jgi:hypothetical protein
MPNWREASRDSIGLTPPAAEISESLFQIFYARAFSWRGHFGVHPWAAWKLKGESQFTIAQVTSWNIRRLGTSVSVYQDLPDRKWYGHDPNLMFQVEGSAAESVIEQVKALITCYPFADQYRVWPGPNSNTVIAYLIRNIPELNQELPPHAIGKDYLANEQFVAWTASKTGIQYSIYGLFGLSIGLKEGLETNILGLNFGFDFWKPAIKLPFIGRVGFSDNHQSK